MFDAEESNGSIAPPKEPCEWSADGADVYVLTEEAGSARRAVYHARLDD